MNPERATGQEQVIRDLSHDLVLQRQRSSSAGRRITGGAAVIVLAHALSGAPVMADQNSNIQTGSPYGSIELNLNPAQNNISQEVILDEAPAPLRMPAVMPSHHRAAAYDFKLDVADRQAIDMLPDPLLRQERLEEQKRYVRRQVESLLGEKMHVRVRITRYDLKDGKLYGEDMQESAIESFKKGRDHRRLHGNSIDREREDAEIDGIEIIEERMANAQTGDKEFFPSPPGGTYPGNFYDIATKKVDDKGEYVEFRRYSSALSYTEYRDFLREMGLQTPDEPDDVFFFTHPIPIDNSRFSTADSLHAYLHREHGYMEREEFDAIIRFSQGAINDYAENPNLFNLKVVINKADEIKDERKNGIIRVFIPNSGLSREERLRLGNKEVKEENLPCGNLNLNDATNGEDRVSVFNRSYEYDIFGSCNTCGKEGMLGPCKMCEACDAKTRREQKKLG